MGHDIHPLGPLLGMLPEDRIIPLGDGTAPIYTAPLNGKRIMVWNTTGVYYVMVCEDRAQYNDVRDGVVRRELMVEYRRQHPSGTASTLSDCFATVENDALALLAALHHLTSGGNDGC